MIKWQPIKTAPKTGEWILCYGIVYEDYEDARRIFTAQWTNFRNGRRFSDGWWQFAWFDGGYYGDCKPTHWAPVTLPDMARKPPLKPARARRRGRP